MDEEGPVGSLDQAVVIVKALLYNRVCLDRAAIFEFLAIYSKKTVEGGDLWTAR